MHRHTYRMRSRAWASRHHTAPSRVHREPSAPPPSGSTRSQAFPVTGETFMGNSLHLQPSMLRVHVPIAQPRSWGLCHHPAAHARLSYPDPKICISLSILTANYANPLLSPSFVLSINPATSYIAGYDSKR